MSALEVERTRVEGARELEEGRRRAAEAVVDERDAEIKSLKQHQETMQDEIDRVNAELSGQRVAQSKEQQRRRAIYMTFGFITGGALWRWSDSILMAITPPTPPFWPSALTGIAIIKLLGALVFSVPSFLFLRGTNWKDRTKVALASIVIIVTLVLSQLLDKELLSITGSLVESAAFLVALVLAAGLISRNGGSGDSHHGLDHS